jgi:hypothetical protein
VLAELAKAGISTIEALTLHGLRRGAAILSEATGTIASETAGQLGQRNPTITTGIYMVATKHRARLSQAERAAFAEAVSWASMGTSAQTDGPSLEIVPEACGGSRLDTGFQASGRSWDRTSDLPRVKRALSR